MRISNLTNSPYELMDAEGRSVRLPARGAVEIDPDLRRLALYRSIGYFRIEEGVELASPQPTDLDSGSTPTPTVEAPVAVEAPPEATVAEISLDSLREKYKALAGKEADKRWANKRIQTEIDKLEGLI